MVVDSGQFSAVAYTNGLVWTTSNERGVTMTNAYDVLMRLINSSDPRGTVSSTYTNLDLISAVDRMGHVSTFGYDRAGRKLWLAEPLNRTSWVGYYSWGGAGYSTTALGQVSQSVYDNLGRTLAVIAPDGNGTTNTYNLLGQLVSTTDAVGVSATNYYNNQGIVYTVSNALGRLAFLIFDARDRVTNSVDANGLVSVTTYDALSRPVATSWPTDGSKVSSGYDAHGLAAYTNQLQQVTRYPYDVASRNTATTNANQEVTRFAYDSSGNRTNLLDGKNQSTSWAFDQFNRMTNKVDATGTVIFTYASDADSRRSNPSSAATGNN